ncbi:tumor necrosis factor receptor superfamily member 21 [Synchiropus picturatus]
MSVICVSAVLLWTVVVDISCHVLTTAKSADPPTLSARHYRYTDPESGTQLVCDKCPAGTYVSVHCSSTAVRECSPCPEGSFTRGENGVQQCHQCLAPCPVGLVEKAPCTATQDRVCSCPPNSFLSGAECKPHSLCPPGTRVKKPGSDTEDVVCKPCTRGTFSDQWSSGLRCRTHTDCKALGLVVLKAGTRESNNVCGPTSTALSPPSTSPVSTTHLEQGQATPSSSALYVHLGSSRLSAAMQLRPNLNGKDRSAERVYLLQSSSTEPPQPDLLKTLLPPVRRSPVELNHQLGQAVQNANKRTSADDVEGSRGSMNIIRTAAQASRDGVGGVSSYYRPTRRGSPRPSPHNHFDINEHLPWMIVLLLLLVLVVIVVCSVTRSSRVLKKGPSQDPSSIMEKAIQKKPPVPSTYFKEKWLYYSKGQGVDILQLVATNVGTQWIDVYQSLASATEREVAAFSNGYSSDRERAYAALQHWTIRDRDANLAKLINALHRLRRIDVVEKIRCVMEDNPQFDLNQLMTTSNGIQSPNPKALGSPSSLGGSSSSSSSGVSVGSCPGMEQSPVDRTKGFFPDESEPLLRCDSTSSKDSALSRTGSFITKEKKDTVLRQVRLDPCDLQPIFDDMLHILNPDELHVIEEMPTAEDKLDQLFEIAGVKSQEASQTLLDSVYSHLPDLL